MVYRGIIRPSRTVQWRATEKRTQRPVEGFRGVRQKGGGPSEESEREVSAGGCRAGVVPPRIGGAGEPPVPRKLGGRPMGARPRDPRPARTAAGVARRRPLRSASRQHHALPLFSTSAVGRPLDDDASAVAGALPRRDAPRAFPGSSRPNCCWIRRRDVDVRAVDSRPALFYAV